MEKIKMYDREGAEIITWFPHNPMHDSCVGIKENGNKELVIIHKGVK